MNANLTTTTATDFNAETYERDVRAGRYDDGHPVECHLCATEAERLAAEYGWAPTGLRLDFRFWEGGGDEGLLETGATVDARFAADSETTHPVDAWRGILGALADAYANEYDGGATRGCEMEGRGVSLACTDEFGDLMVRVTMDGDDRYDMWVVHSWL